MSKFKKWYLNKNVKPLYNIKDINNYYEPINYFYKMYNIPQLHKTIDDEVISYYIKSMKDISIIVVYPPALKYPNLIKIMTTDLEKNGTIHYIKDITMDYYMMYNLIYQLYSYESRMKITEQIMAKLNSLHFTLDTSHKIKIIVYSLHNKELLLHGKSVEYKMFLRNIFFQYDLDILNKKNISYDDTNISHIKMYDYLHVSDNDMMAYDYASIFFNKNSIRFLKKQKSWKLIEFANGKNYLNTIKSFILSNHSQLEMEKLLVISSGVLYSYGIRDMNDIDCILLTSDKINKLDIDNITGIDKDKIDISYQPNLDKKWEDELNNRAEQLGALNYMELVLNPKYYYYFMGIKFLRLKYEIIIRAKRKRPAQFTDLLVIKQIYNFKYSLIIPIETKIFDENKQIDIIKKVNINEYVDTIKYYLKTRYYINLTNKQILQWIQNINNNMIAGSNSNINSNILYQIIDDVSNNNIIYPLQEIIIKMGYEPSIIIYSDNKPYLYPGEDFNIKGCFYKKTDMVLKTKIKNNLRICTFNVHNFIKRCNMGIAPLFDYSINPFETPRDVMKFIDFFTLIDADILCLQELVPIINKQIIKDITDYSYIRDNFNFIYLNNLMENIGYKYHVIGPTQQGHLLKNTSKKYYYLANGIYSKIKFEQTFIYSYNFINRNSIMASILWNNKLVNIYCNHWEYINIDNVLILQSNALMDIINSNNNNNTILCGDFNINIFQKKEGARYKNWNEKTKFLRDNFISTNKSQIATNFSQLEQTDFIMISKNNNIKIIYSTIVKTDISDHYAVLTDII